MAEFTTKDRERLVTVEVELKELNKDFKEYMKQAKSLQGFPRCAARSVQIENVEKNVVKIERHFTWLVRSVLGATILAAVGLMWSHIGDFAQKMHDLLEVVP